MIKAQEFCVYSPHEKEEKRKPIIDDVILGRYITQEGFRCMYDNLDSIYPKAVRVENSIVKRLYSNAVYEYLESVLSKDASLYKWLYPLRAKKDLLFISTVMQMKRIEPELLSDTEDASYIPFENGIVMVTKDSIELKKYGEVLTGGTCILYDKIIHRKVDLSTGSYLDSDWYRFCRNSVGEEGLPYLMRVLGYLLHTYKDEANAKMIMFSDTSLTNNNAMGGSGKSLIANVAIKQMRSVYWVDGKEFDPKGRFKFQGIKQEDDVICIDDIPKGFRQEVLYNKVTGNFSSEEKFKSQTTLSFENAFKTVITGNYGLLVTGGSDKRRTCMIGFTDYYNEKHKPINEFGHKFFTNWKGNLSGQWQHFNNFMFDCIKMYLNEGIESYKYEQIVQKAMINAEYTVAEMIEANMHQIIGEENAMNMIAWETKIGTGKGNAITLIRQYMESHGYVDKTTRKQGNYNPTRDIKHYWEKR